MSADDLPVNRVTDQILGAAIEVHRVLGPGLLESAYESCLAFELGLRQVPVERQMNLPVRYKDHLVESGFRVDLLVDGLVVVELKAVEKLLPIHQAQILTYLKLTGCRVGLLLNFNVKRLKDGGIQRFAQNLL